MFTLIRRSQLQERDIKEVLNEARVIDGQACGPASVIFKITRTTNGCLVLVELSKKQMEAAKNFVDSIGE